MVIKEKVPGTDKKRVLDYGISAGEKDYIKDGILYKHSPSSSVIVTAESDLASLNEYEVGTIAYTAGFAKMWQLAANGDWISIT